ncbi:hypothetical protein [Methylotenera sp.]|nr:hypothetical protein [Methylotenera sp.]MDI1300130.1 hypothetical protein [Methylotenera sp.]
MIKRIELSQPTSKVGWAIRCPRVTTSETPVSAWAEICPRYLAIVH